MIGEAIILGNHSQNGTFCTFYLNLNDSRSKYLHFGLKNEMNFTAILVTT